jgi:GH43 family beta-xylosidase
MTRFGMNGDARYQLDFELLEPRLALAGMGLTAQYFHNDDFTGLADTRLESVSHNWGTAAPAAGVDADSFSVRWSGQIEPQFSQLYTFRVLADEGVRVWVDGKLVINDWAAHVRRAVTGTIALVAGRRYDIRVDYYDVSGAAQIELSWLSASQPQQVIPASRLYESPAGILGSYTDTTSGNLSRVDSAIDFNWGLGSPHPSLDSDGLRVTWSGQIRADFSEEYTFSTISDDGVRLWIGNELVIDNWTNQTGSEARGTKQLEAGKWTEVRLEYYDNTGSAEARWLWSSPRQTGSGPFEVVPQENLRAIKPAPVVFENPLGTGADPFVIQWEGDYYITRSDGARVWIDRAKSLEDIHSSSLGSDTVLAWDPPSGTNYSEEVWAPELHNLDDNWYIYVAASNGSNETHRMHVLERTADDPFGPFVYKGQINAATNRWAIDGTVLQWQGFEYFVWSGWPGSSNGQQNLYIAEMLNPWTLRTDRVQISAPQHAWEMHGMSINEGPQVLIENGKLHIIYSASGYWTPQYALGRLTYNGSGSLLNPASWTKIPQPVFRSAGNVVGVGHASFVKSPDGTENWIVYHAHKNPLPDSGEIRDVRMQPFTFFADGTPNFGTPLPDGPIPVPSVGADAERAFIVGDYNADGVVDSRDHATWRATFGMLVFPASAADGNGNGIVDTADYIIWRRYRSDAATQSVVAQLEAAPRNAAAALKDTDVKFSDISSAGIRPQYEAKRRPVLLPEEVDVALSAWRTNKTWYLQQRGPRRELDDSPANTRDIDAAGDTSMSQRIGPSVRMACPSGYHLKPLASYSRGE